MRRFVLYLIILSVMQVTCIALNAQTTPQGKASQTVPVKMLVYKNLDNDCVLKAFTDRFAQLDTLIAAASRYESNPLDCSTFNRASIADSLYEAKAKDEARSFKRRNGLEVTGQVYQRLDNTLGFDDDDQYSQYSTKIQAELGWNFFNSGFFQRKSELRAIRLDNKLKALQYGKEQGTVFWTEVADGVERKYDRLIATVLYQELQNLDILNLAYQYMLERDRVANDKLFEAVSEKMRVEYDLSRICHPDSVKDAPLTLLRPTVIEVDSVRLFAAVDSYNADVQEAKVREELIEAKKKLTNYAQSVRLTPFLRASHYISRNLSTSTNIDLGVRFTIPLYDDASAKRKAMTTERRIAELDRQNLGTGIRQQCTRLITQLEQFNRAVTTEDFHMRQIMQMIGLRRKAYTAATRAYNHVRRMEEYSEYLRSVERMYKLMKMRELCLIDINKAAGCPDFALMVSEKDI